MAELADVTDLKSVDLNNREGSSPSIPITIVLKYNLNQHHHAQL